MSPCCHTLRDAAKEGHVACLRRLRREVARWDPGEVLEVSARNGHVAGMEYALDHGAAWTSTVMRHAVAHVRDGGSDAAFRMALDHRAPWFPSFARMCVDGRLFELLRGVQSRHADVPRMELTLSEAWHVLTTTCRSDVERRIALDAMEPAFVYLMWQQPAMCAYLSAAGLTSPGPPGLHPCRPSSNPRFGAIRSGRSEVRFFLES